MLPADRNAIIYYNTLLLSRVYEQKLAAGDLEAVKILKGTSPVAWRNVNALLSVFSSVPKIALDPH
jgi:hypothetical protein